MSRPSVWNPFIVSSAALGAAILAATCGAASGPRGLDVRCYGAFREIIHEGRIEGRTSLASAATQPHAYALGALARLDGEFMVLDGKPFLSRPDHQGGVVNVRSVTERDSAALMVIAHVPAWRAFQVTHTIPLSSLPDTLATRAAALGLPRGGPFPFRIEGIVSRLAWHVADGSKLPPGPSTHEAHARAAVHGARDRVTVTMLGFYSDHDAGVFLHHDSNVHVHVLLEGGLAAHVDSVTVEPDAVLRLPDSR